MSDNAQSQIRLVAAISYVFTPVVPLIVFATGMAQDPFLKRHAIQAILWFVGFLVLLTGSAMIAVVMLRQSLLLVCLLPLVLLIPFVPGAFWAWRVRRGSDVHFPVITPLLHRRISAGQYQSDGGRRQ